MKKNAPVYMIGYFRSGPGRTGRVEKLHLAYSRDGLNWYELNQNNPVWETSLGEGVLRDPFINRGNDGKWHLVFTIRPLGKKLGYASSADLITWEDEKELEVMENYDNVVNTWAPEFNYDPEQGDYLLYWASSVGDKISNNKHYAARTTDWNTFTAAELFFDPGFQTIDASIVPSAGKNYMFYKDESYVYDPITFSHPPGNKLAVADQLGGPYKTVSDYITPDFTEGPEILKLKDQQKWYLIYDYWKYGRFGVMESSNSIDWSEELDTEAYRFPFRIRHATVFSPTEQELWKLLNKYGLEAHYPVVVHDYVKLAEYSSNGFMHDEFTMRSIAMRVNANQVSSTQVLYDEGGSDGGVTVQLNDNQLEAVVSNGSSKIKLTTPFDFTGEWHNIAVVFNEGKFSIYVDGEPRGSNNASFKMVESHIYPGGIGRRFEVDAFGQAEGEAKFAGKIRDVRIYTVPLQDADIQNLYVEGK